MFQASLFKSPLRLPTILRIKPKLLILAQGLQWSSPQLYLRLPLLLGFYPLAATLASFWSLMSTPPQDLGICPERCSLLLSIACLPPVHGSHCIPSFTFSEGPVLTSPARWPSSWWSLKALNISILALLASASCDCNFALWVITSIMTHLGHQQEHVCFSFFGILVISAVPVMEQVLNKYLVTVNKHKVFEVYAWVFSPG